MKHRNHQQDIDVTAACTKIITEATKGIGQKYRKLATEYCFLFDGWFLSNKAEEATIEGGANLVGTVKTNTKGFCKENIEKLAKD